MKNGRKGKAYAKGRRAVRHRENHAFNNGFDLGAESMVGKVSGDAWVFGDTKVGGDTVIS